MAHHRDQSSFKPTYSLPKPYRFFLSSLFLQKLFVWLVLIFSPKSSPFCCQIISFKLAFNYCSSINLTLIAPLCFNAFLTCARWSVSREGKERPRYNWPTKWGWWRSGRCTYSFSAAVGEQSRYTCRRDSLVGAHSNSILTLCFYFWWHGEKVKSKRNWIVTTLSIGYNLE